MVAHDLVAAALHDGAATHAARGAGALELLEIPRAGLEAVRRRSERTDRADLHGVAGKVGTERLVRERHHLGVVASAGERDQRITGDLAGESCAAITENAALAVEVHEIADGNRLFVVALFFDVTTFAWSVGERLILQRALSAFVAHRTVEWVVRQQQFEHALLRAFGRIGRGRHHLSFGDRRHARYDECLATRPLDLDDALATHSNRRHARVVTEVRHERARILTGINQQLTWFGLDGSTVDRDADRALWFAGLGCLRIGHRRLLTRGSKRASGMATPPRRRGVRARCNARTRVGSGEPLMQSVTRPTDRADRSWSDAVARRCLG